MKISNSIINKLALQDQEYPPDHDLCVLDRSTNVDIIRSDVDQRWSILIDFGRLAERYKTRSQAVQYLKTSNIRRYDFE